MKNKLAIFLGDCIDRELPDWDRPALGGIIRKGLETFESVFHAKIEITEIEWKIE